MFAAFLNALPYVLGSVLLLFLLYGFWQGLTLRPHEPEHRSNTLPFWWRWW